MDVCHLFPQCILAIIPLKGGMTGVVTRACPDIEQGLPFALWLSLPCQRWGLLPSCWSRGPQISFLAVILIFGAK